LQALGALLGAPVLAIAQQPAGKTQRIGFLTAAGLSDPVIDGFRQGLREAQYIEGRNVSIELRAAEGDSDRLPGLAADLVKMRVALIVANASLATLAAKRATTEIPVVFTLVSDPVAQGFVRSMAHPDANLTGVSGVRDAAIGKELELLKEVAPSIRAVTLVCGPRNRPMELNLQQAQISARTLGLKSRIVELGDPSAIERSVASIPRGRTEGVFLVPSPWLFVNRARIIELITKQGNPTVGWQSLLAESGALLSYGASNFEIGRRAAALAVKLLRGAQPADIPVEEPAVFELVINLRTAKVIGLKIPTSIIGRADRLIE
jgi:ABC-type uncharacterized transport system substrate-binding protein